MKDMDRDFIGQLSRWHTGSHRDKKARPDKDEVLIENGCEIIVPKGSDIIIRTAVKDFVRYLKVCMGVDVTVRYVKRLEEKGEVVIIMRNYEVYPELSMRLLRLPLAMTTRTDGAFVIRSDNSCVAVIGKGSRGVMYGLYHLEKLFNFRGAPILKRGEIKREPVFRERLTNTVFSKIWEDPGDKDAYPDEYFSLPSNMKRTESILVELVSIAKEELQNAEQALELVKRDYRLGYGYTYGRAYTPDLIEKKIEHTKNVIEKEIPQFAYYYGTHLFEDEPDEFEEGGWNVVS